MPATITPADIDLIVFDLDGTLADSLPDLANAANHACRRLGLPEHPPEAIKDMIGGGERKFAQRFLGTQDPELLEKGLNIYLDYYRRHCGDLTRLYPGVKETLPRLRSKKLAVLSNKRQNLTELVLEVLGIRGFFAAVRGGGDLPLKPDPTALLAVIKELGQNPSCTLMVGDKTADIQSARGAGARVVAVTYGYGDPEALAAAGPDALVNRFSQLPELLDL
jgi:phosphoglycolate phosphatase